MFSRFLNCDIGSRYKKYNMTFVNKSQKEKSKKLILRLKRIFVIKCVKEQKDWDGKVAKKDK